MQVALQWCSDSFSDHLVGFVNNVKTVDGGTHMDGLKAALTRTLNTLARYWPAAWAHCAVRCPVCCPGARGLGFGQESSLPRIPVAALCTTAVATREEGRP